MTRAAMVNFCACAKLVRRSATNVARVGSLDQHCKIPAPAIHRLALPIVAAQRPVSEAHDSSSERRAPNGQPKADSELLPREDMAALEAVAGFHMASPHGSPHGVPGFYYSSSDSESESTLSDDSDDASLTTATTRTTDDGGDDEEWRREGRAALDAAVVAAAPAEALAGALREYGSDARFAKRGAARLEAHYASKARISSADAARVASVVATELLRALRRANCDGAALRACAAACARGDVFVDRFVALGGLACALEALRRCPDDETVQRAGLGILGHARLLDRETSARLSAPRAVDAIMDALSRHGTSARFVGLASLALYNAAHADQGAAATAADSCHLLVASLNVISDDSARAAGCWTLGALAGLEGLRDDGARINVAVAVRKAGAFALFAETVARFPEFPAAARNARLARDQLQEALGRRRAAAETSLEAVERGCAVQ